MEGCETGVAFRIDISILRYEVCYYFCMAFPCGKKKGCGAFTVLCVDEVRLFLDKCGDFR
jgi:hypothetical protein